VLIPIWVEWVEGEPGVVVPVRGSGYGARVVGRARTINPSGRISGRGGGGT